MDPTIERILLHQLSIAWTDLNNEYLRGALRPVAIELRDTTTTLGQWRGPSRTIALSRSMCVHEPWPFIVDVLKHEMAHQYVDEVLRPENETAHGPAFQRTCNQFGIPSRSALPHSPESTKPNPIIQRIQRLLKLAESTNEHEAQGAVRRAKQLLQRHKIDHLGLPQPNYFVRYLGTARTRVPAAEKVLAGILARDFFVTAIWVPGSAPSEAKATKILEISGLEHHVKLAEHVHSFLLRTIESLWQEAKKLYGYRGRSAKRRFSLGLLQGFAEREPVEPSTTELVKQHDTMLRNFVRTRHPRLRKGRSTKVFCDSAYRHGHSRGRNITVHPSLDNGRNKAKEASNKQLVMKVDSHR